MPDGSLRDALAQRIRAVLTGHGDMREVSMFGVLSFMVHQRMTVAAGRDGGLLVRTDPADHDDLIQRGGEPAHMGNGRPMGAGWLVVPAARLHDDADLAFWVTVALETNVPTQNDSAG